MDPTDFRAVGVPTFEPWDIGREKVFLSTTDSTAYPFTFGWRSTSQKFEAVPHGLARQGEEEHGTRPLLVGTWRRRTTRLPTYRDTYCDGLTLHPEVEQALAKLDTRGPDIFDTSRFVGRDDNEDGIITPSQ